jgi:magnesium-transporting ATPase (P-type)
MPVFFQPSVDFASCARKIHRRLKKHRQRKPMKSQPVYAIRKNEVFAALETSPQGLSSEEIQTRLGLYGRNDLAEPAASPVWQKWIGAVTHPSALLLWLAGTVTLFTGQPVLAGVIWLVVLVNATFSFYREYWAGRAVTGLKHFLPATARVVRNGQDTMVSVSELVPGDVLILAEGDRIPADARVIEEFGLRVNNATLTGEAVPARKNGDASLREDLSEIERPNLIFAGTTVVAGTGRAVVYATGMLTQFGRIANLTHNIPEAPGGLQREMAQLSRVLSLTGLVIGIIVLIVASNDVGLAPGEAFVLAIGIVVAVIPEGLSPTVTLSLAAGVQRLAQKGVLVKKLSILETVGNISVLCTDKSGTLTQNQMTVCNIWVGRSRFQVTGVGYEPKGEIIQEDLTVGVDLRVDPDRTHRSTPTTEISGDPSCNEQPDLEGFLTAALLCNNARLQVPTPGQPRWSALGDQTEAALLAMALKGNLQEAHTRYPRVHELPFDARRKRMCTIHRGPDGQEIAFVKGSPKEVLQLCTQIGWQGQIIPLTDVIRAQIMMENDRYACQALRVLALARRNLPPRSGSYTIEGVEQNLTFLGLAAMMDPPRPEVDRAITAFRRAGIRMVMITGDYGLTAESLARRIGMITGPAPRILTGVDLETLDETQLIAALDQETIFARMAPEHKLRLVAAFQQRNEVVAVVGDGVNDAPALRKADIGIAMGLSGTDVAREAADIILTQDNFELIVRAIEEGRAVYDNLRKFMTYIFASNVPEVLPFLLTALFDLPLALTVLQVLIIDLGTDLLPALALGMEKPEPDILNRPPRKRGQPLLDRGLLARSFAWLGPLEAALCYAGFLWVLGFNPAFWGGQEDVQRLASTVFLAGVIIAQVGNSFACRSEKGNVRWIGLFSNRPLLAGIAIQILLLLGMVYLRPVAATLELTALPPLYWVGLALFAPGLYGLERSRKWLFRQIRLVKSRGA